MSKGDAAERGVWFVYDGDCPICEMAALALKIRENCGPLHLLDARQKLDHWLLRSINERGFDLDEGMVIYFNEAYYHGSDALHFMALFGADKGWFNRINSRFFKNKHIARFCYPLMRAGRNALLKIRGIQPVMNLTDREAPIFQAIFAESWSSMPPVMHWHYANRPFSQDVNICKGHMQVQCAFIMRLFAPVMHFMGGIPIINADAVPVTVRFESDTYSPSLHFVRSFHLPDRPPYIFHSRMVPRQGSDVIEVMKFRLCWRSRFSWQDDKVILSHRGYCLHLLGAFIPLPVSWLVGRIHAEEQVVNEDSFSMFVEIRHWLFGKIYSYRGTFKMVARDD